ncbi:MAG: DUF3536 domain-containing protein, partial [Chloroflexota bacterium]|nr:DUF3536 domain-containing protein [Chloroflexota bacterium]
MSRGRLVVHAHFYQPSRMDPFSGRLPADASAAPFRDWNARTTAECYRPNAELGSLAHVSWDLGPTLSSYLASEAPDVLEAFAAADIQGGGTDNGPGIAQPFHHAILPLAPVHDRRTEIRWGLRDFEMRFGRRATAIWLPETAVDMATLRILAEEGVTGTILAPWQADTLHLDARRPYRVDVGAGRHVAVAFYDGDLSGAISFEPTVTADADRFAREQIAPRLAGSLRDGAAPMLVIASDGELYGHHQAFRDLFLQRLVAPSAETPDRGFDVVTLSEVLAEAAGQAHPEIRIRERTSWSCHHGVLRWSGECPDALDGRWKGPLRAALERLAGGIDTVTEGLAREMPGLDDVWASRDRYVDVVLGVVGGDAFAAAELGPGADRAARSRLLGLMEAQRWRLGMFASCGWFWDDPSRPETHHVLQAAARAVRLIDEQAGTNLERRLVADLALFESPPSGSTGRRSTGRPSSGPASTHRATGTDGPGRPTCLP